METLFWVLLALMLLAMALDLETTLHNLNQGDVEANPIIAWYFGKFGLNRIPLYGVNTFIRCLPAALLNQFLPIYAVVTFLAVVTAVNTYCGIKNYQRHPWF